MPLLWPQGEYDKGHTGKELAVGVEEGEGEKALAEVDEALRDTHQ
jgi:hypothetical protein